MMTAQQAYQAWLLKVEIVAGGACLLIFAVCVAVAVILVANSRNKRE